MSSVKVVIKNLNTGKYIHPTNQHPNIPESDLLVLWEGTHSNTHYVFEQVDGKWGYIRHTKSDKVWHPYLGPSNAKTDNTKVCLHSDRKPWALFTIDAETGHIMHKDGLYVHYNNGQNPNPANGNHIVLHQDIHHGMKWECVVSDFTD